MADRFLEKVVVILGGNSGIGLASAKAFADEGAQVIITGRDPDTLLIAAQVTGHSTIAFRSDISDLRQNAAIFADIHKTLGRIDVLFVNAGVLAVLPIESVSEAEWDRIYDYNLKGAFFSVQAALPLMSRGSNIILNSSVATHKGEPGVSVYASSKAGVRALGRSLAGELVGRGIRVNVISPGLIYTPIFLRAHRTDNISAEDVPTILQRMSENVPMRRMGSPEEVAAAVLFLASDAAAYITGIDLPVDGGFANL